MKAALIQESGQKFQILDIDVAEPIGHEVLIQVKTSGLCQSDYHIAQDGHGFGLPLLLGHEIAGDVVAVGPDVKDFVLGDRVVACHIRSCGTCARCRAGRPFQCQDPTAMGRTAAQPPRYSIDGEAITQFMGVGGFAEYALVNENMVVPIRDEMPYAQASLLGCAVVAGAGAVLNTARIAPGDTVAVVGCGGVGLNAIQAAKLSGAKRVIAVDVVDSKLELARKFGATDVVNSLQVDPVEAVKELTAGGVTHSFEVVGLIQTVNQAFDMLEKGGTTYLIGVHKPGSKVEFEAFGGIVSGQKGIRGVVMGATNMKLDIPL